MSLIVVGTGIQCASQTSPVARAHIEKADKVLFLVADPATIVWIKQLNPTAESLDVFYDPAKLRVVSYLEMVEHTLSFVRKGLAVCLASYGHPGVFAFPMHESVRRARREGFHAIMLPGISSEDCLFADLGVDPGETGCQSFEATNFLIHNQKFDSTSALILWQVGVIGHVGYQKVFSLDGVNVLVEVLLQHYSPDHEVVVYEAPPYAICDPSVQRIALKSLASARITPISTLYIPPKQPMQLNTAMMDRLGIPRSYIATAMSLCGQPNSSRLARCRAKSRFGPAST
jgi:uncharacterized protein YabN with tetrapyrrole methylase and pyrophosphatase domain